MQIKQAQRLVCHGPQTLSRAGSRVREMTVATVIHSAVVDGQVMHMHTSRLDWRSHGGRGSGVYIVRKAGKKRN